MGETRGTAPTNRRSHGNTGLHLVERGQLQHSRATMNQSSRSMFASGQFHVRAFRVGRDGSVPGGRRVYKDAHVCSPQTWISGEESTRDTTLCSLAARRVGPGLRGLMWMYVALCCWSTSLQTRRTARPGGLFHREVKASSRSVDVPTAAR